jgi:two-component system response regulator TctD
MRILIVEDDASLGAGLARILEAEGFAVDVMKSGEHAAMATRQESFDLVILDVGLPGIDGFEVLRRLRAEKCVMPILILTARDALDDRVRGLDLGADDYMAKPFEVHELEARMRALLRRVNQQKNPILTCGSLCYNSNSREFSLGGAPLALTPREHSVLEMLMMKSGKTVSKRALAESLFSIDEDVNPDAIEIYIHRVRKKLEPGDTVIVTLRGLGYLLKPRYEP